MEKEKFYKEFSSITNELHCLTRLDPVKKLATSYYKGQPPIEINMHIYEDHIKRTDDIIKETTEANYLALMKALNFTI